MPSTKTYDKYKDSGIEWIGKIPKIWKLVKTRRVFCNTKEIVGKKSILTERLALTLNGVIRRKKDDVEGLQPEQFDGYQYLRKNQLVFKLIDLENVSTSRVGLCPFDEGMVSPAYIVLKNVNSDNRYYHYYFISLWYNEIFNYLGGEGVRSALNAKDLLNIPTFDLTKDEQQQIADYLDKKCAEIDRVVETQKDIIEKLKEYKQSVITEAVTKGIDKAVPLKASGIEWIGEIPQHWEMVKFKKVVENIADIDHYMPETVDNGYPYLMTGDLKDFASLIDFISCKQISEIDYNSLSTKIHPLKDDVIFARYATIGTICYVDITSDFLVSYSCLTIRPLADKSIGKFLYYYLKSSIFIIDIFQYVNSNTQSNVGLDSLKKAHIVLPKKEEQENIAAYLDKKCTEIDNAIKDKEQLIEKLTEYKKALIYECVTGKRKVIE